MQLVVSGRATPAQHQRLTSLAQTLCARDELEVIVLAGTDLALIFDDTNTPFPQVDCARLHIEGSIVAVVSSASVPTSVSTASTRPLTCFAAPRRSPRSRSTAARDD